MQSKLAKRTACFQAFLKLLAMAGIGTHFRPAAIGPIADCLLVGPSIQKADNKHRAACNGCKRHIYIHSRPHNIYVKAGLGSLAVGMSDFGEKHSKSRMTRNPTNRCGHHLKQVR